MLILTANFITACAMIIQMVLNIMWWLLIIRCLLSWVNPDPYNMIVRLVYQATEPVLKPFRRLIPAWKTGFDFSIIFAMMFLIFTQYFLVASLFDIAHQIETYSQSKGF